MRRAFTLVELLVSITVLLVILGAVARIFRCPGNPDVLIGLPR